MATINLGRIGNMKQFVEVEDGISIKSAFVLNDIEIAENEVIRDMTGDEYEAGDDVEDGATYMLVAHHKNA